MQTLIPRFTNPLCRAILRLTSNRGLRTLSRMSNRLFPTGVTVKCHWGSSLYIPPDDHLFGFTLGIHEQHITQFLGQILRAGDTCVDVGANIGYFTNQMAALVGTRGRVIALEPVPETFAVLTRNTQLANQFGTVVIALRAAASSETAQVQINRKQFCTYHEVERLTDGHGTSVDTARGVRLDQELPRIGMSRRVRLLKIDVEGHEYQALRGCEGLLSAGLVDHLIIEVTPGDKLHEIGRLLEKYKGTYECWVGGKWNKLALAALSQRTDIKVCFR